MASFRSKKSIPEDQMNGWIRVLSKRQAECRNFDEKQLETLEKPPIVKDLEVPATIKGAQRIDWLMENLLSASLDDNISPTRRRDAYIRFKVLLRRIEVAVETLRKTRVLQTHSLLPFLINNGQNGSLNTETQRPKSNQDIQNPPNNATSNDATKTPSLPAPTQEIGKEDAPSLDLRYASVCRPQHLQEGGVENIVTNGWSTEGVHRNGSLNPIQNEYGAKASTQEGQRGVSQSRKDSVGALTAEKPALAQVKHILNRKDQAQNTGKAKDTGASERNAVNHRLSSNTPNPTSSSTCSASSVPESIPLTREPPDQENPTRLPSVSESNSAPSMGAMTSAPLVVASTAASSSLATRANCSAGASILPTGAPYSKLSIPLIPSEPQPRESRIIRQYIRGIDKSYTGALEKYPEGTYIWNEAILADSEIKDAIQRLHIWEPYWEMVHIVALTKTSPIIRVDRQKQAKTQGGVPIKPNCAAALNVSVPVKFHKKIEGWNTELPAKHKYNHGDVRLLIHAIPCQVAGKPKEDPKKKVAAKKGRSDSHEWPKGTLLMTDHRERNLTQRKQQAHDSNEWSYKSTMLDLSQYTTTPEKVEVTIVTFDSESYYLCAAVCRYQSPSKLFQTLWDNSIEKLSFQESLQLARHYARKNAVCCLDDVVDEDGADSSFIFKLTCPLQGLLKTPVRARQCNHFQCFDLGNFLGTSINAGAGRWECPVCGNERISVYDLQHCGLTASLLERFKGEASIFKDRVQLFADGRFDIMPEKRKRHSVTDDRGGDKRLQTCTEVIDLL